MNHQFRLGLGALLVILSMSAWASETAQPKEPSFQDYMQQITGSLSQIAKNQQQQLGQDLGQLNLTNANAQALMALLSRIEANQQTLIKQNAATQKILGQLMLQQAQQSMLKGVQ